MGRVQRDLCNLWRKIKASFQRKSSYVDFSVFSYKGYSLVVSTYNCYNISNKSDLNALAKDDDLVFLNEVSSLFEAKRSKFEKIIMAFFSSGRIRHLGENDSLVYLLYCAGFQSGYKNVDKKLVKRFFNKADCNRIVNEHIATLSDLDIKIFQDCDKISLSRARNHIIDVGSKSGAIFRGLLFEEERKKTLLMDINIFDEEVSFENLFKSKAIFPAECVYKYIDSQKPKAKKIAVLFAVLQMNECLDASVAEFSRCVESIFDYNVGDKSSIYAYLNPNNSNRNIIDKEKGNMFNDLKELSKEN